MSRTPGLLLNRQMGNDNAPCFAEEVPLSLLLSHFNKMQSTQIELGNCPPEHSEGQTLLSREICLAATVLGFQQKYFSDTPFISALLLKCS